MKNIDLKIIGQIKLDPCFIEQMENIGRPIDGRNCTSIRRVVGKEALVKNMNLKWCTRTIKKD